MNLLNIVSWCGTGGMGWMVSDSDDTADHTNDPSSPHCAQTSTFSYDFYIFFPSWHCGFFAQTYLPIWLGGLFSWMVERIVSALQSYLILKTYMCLYFTTISSLDSRVRIFEMWRSLESGRLDIWDHYQRCSQSRSKSHKKSKSNFIYEVFSFTK